MARTGSLALILASLGIASLASAQAPGKTKLVVDAQNTTSIKTLIDEGATLVADRGGYLVYEISDSQRSATSNLPGVMPREDFNVISLNRGEIDVRQGAAPAPQLFARGSFDRHLKLVQFPAPPTDEDLAALTDTGAEIVHYVPANSYIVWVPSPKTTERLQKLSVARGPGGLSYLGEYYPEYALQPGLDQFLGADGEVDVTVQFYNHSTTPGGKSVNDDLEIALQSSTKLIEGPFEVLDNHYINVRLTVPASELPVLAALESVVTVEPWIEPSKFGERQGQIMAGNMNSGRTAPTGAGYLAWLSSKGFSTDRNDYPVVTVVDDGIDNGNAANPVVAEFRVGNNGANPSRLTFSVLPPGASATDGAGAGGPDGHGHINGSIVGGYNDGIGVRNEDASGYNYGLGISPHGRLSSVRIFSPGFNTGSGEENMIRDYYDRGTQISTNSWGLTSSTVFGNYHTSSQMYDRLTRDAKSTTSGNQELLFIFAAGNDGSAANTVSPPATGKNVLTVGASENVNNTDAALYGSGCGDTASQANNAQDMATFSSRGPCDDQRVKPDIVAPGVYIYGSAPHPVDTFFNGSGVCGASTNNFSGSGADAVVPTGMTPLSDYTWSSGTSHSTPAIAGYTSLIGEFLTRVYGFPAIRDVNGPSPALVKAYVVHSGQHMSGSGANENLPGNNQGYGLADMGLGFNTDASRFFVNQSHTFGASGQNQVYTGFVENLSQPLRISLAWTDAPGATSGNAYVNDLNLTVQVGGNTYLGNVFNAGTSVTGGSADFRNNVESVFLPAGTSGQVTITVSSQTIAGDGVPGNADTTDQDFALVVFNFTQLSGKSTVTAGPTTEPSSISSLQTASWDAPFAFDFTVNDDAQQTNIDSLPTLIEKITIGPGPGNTVADWSGAIAGASLTDGVTTVQATSIGTSGIIFDGLPTGSGAIGRVTDNASKTYQMRYWLKESAGNFATIDGESFAFRVAGTSMTTATSGSSGFGDNGNIDSSASAVTVNATELRFTTQPTDTFPNTSFAAAVSATDANGNVDRDYSSNITLSTACSDGTLSAVSGLTKAPTNGTSSWTDLRINQASPCRLNATSGAFSKLSNTFIVFTESRVTIESWANSSLNTGSSSVAGSMGRGTILRGTVTRVNTSNRWNNRAWTAATSPNLTSYFYWNLNTTGFQDIVLNYKTLRDSNGPTRVQLWHGANLLVSASTSTPSYLTSTSEQTFNWDFAPITTVDNVAQANFVIEGYQSGNATTGQMQIYDVSFEGRPLVQPNTPGRFEFQSANFDTVETDGTATVTVVRVGGTQGAATVAYQTVSGGSATAGSDYTSTSGQLNFADGESQKTFSVTIANDSTPEVDETINMTVTSVSGSVIGCQNTATLTILGENQTHTIGNGNPPRRYFTRGARAWLDFSSVSSGNNANVTLHRTDAGISNLAGATSSAIANVRWSVTPNPGLSFSGPVQVTFQYLDGEVFGLDEPNLRLYKGDSAAGPWAPVPGAVIDAANNTVTATITSFSEFTLLDEGPLAVDLVNFSATGTLGGPVEITWETASEVSTAGFNLYRGVIDETRSIQIGEKITDSLIAPLGDEMTGAVYSFTDPVVLGMTPEERAYFLEEKEMGGASNYHGPIMAVISAPAAVEHWILY